MLRINKLKRVLMVVQDCMVNIGYYSESIQFSKRVYIHNI